MPDTVSQATLPVQQDARPIFSGAVEGILDEAVLRRLGMHVGAVPGTVYGKKGKSHLLERLKGYNQAARFGLWVVLVDLDDDAKCAPPFRVAQLPQPSPHMCFRVAVRAVETWLLADRDRLAAFLSVAVSRLSPNPEAIHAPKRAMVELARQSRRRAIREDMVPRPGSDRQVGPAYTSRLIEFVQDVSCGWRPDVAAISSDSLSRCLRCVRQLAGEVE